MTLSSALATASAILRHAGQAERADHLLRKSDEVADRELGEFAPVVLTAANEPRVGHSPVLTEPGSWPGCNGVLRLYPSGDMACDAGCVVLPTTDRRAHPHDNPETCTRCGDGVPFHDAEALRACGLTKETPNA